MRETRRRDTAEQNRARAVRAPSAGNPRSLSDENLSTCEHADALPRGTGGPPLDERDLVWLRLLSWLLIQQECSPLDASTVESGKGPDEAACGQDADGSVTRVDPRPCWRAPHALPLKAAAGLVGLGLSLLLLLLAAASLVMPTATVTIIPRAKMLTTTTTVTVVSDGTSNVAYRQIAGRRFAPFTLSQVRRVPTTGKGHQDASAAHGTLILYNALPAAQTVSAGTLLTGKDGVQVVTAWNAVIPAGSLPTNGWVSVPAHALEPGPGGNISADDLYGACCRPDVFARNALPFKGGQNARTFPTVSRKDVDAVVSALSTDLAHSVQAVLRSQLVPDETLVLPVPCMLHVVADPKVGEEASQVSVALGERCTGTAYSSGALRGLMGRILSHEATHQVGESYALEGQLEVSVQASQLLPQRHETILLLVRAKGTWVYQFTQAQLRRFGSLIAGASQDQATQTLQQQPGVRSVVASIAGGESRTLPVDPKNIHVIVLYQAG